MNSTKHIVCMLIALAAFASPVDSFAAVKNQTPWVNPETLPVVKIVTCKSYRSCAAAVKNWCAGNHPRADGDDDGIPCENVCRSKRQVDKIRREIGC